jgi:pimeloyl-ACP methyl ester carboxylesterase
MLEIRNQVPVEKLVTVYGQQLHYIEAGEGLPMILLHGLGADSGSWLRCVEMFAGSHRVIALDMIGFGKSDKPFLPYRVATLVDFLNGFFEELDIDKAILIGNSLGGWTASLFELIYPEKVEALVLVAAGYLFSDAADPTVLTTKANPATLSELHDLLSLVFYDQARFLSEAAVKQAFTARLTNNIGYTVEQLIASIRCKQDALDGQLANIRAKTLVIAGESDGITSVSLSQRIHQEISHSEYVLFDRCGHSPQVECPERLVAKIYEFLEGAKPNHRFATTTQ